MPIGLLASGGVGEVVSPSRILTLNASGMLQEAVWGSSGSIDLNANGLMQQASGAITYAAWDPASKSSAAVLSASNMRLAQTDASSFDRVVSTLPLTGRVYFEVALHNTDMYSATTGAGVMAYGGGALSRNFVGSDWAGGDVGLYPRWGNGYFYLFWNATHITSPDPSLDGDTGPDIRAGIAVDVATRQVWMRVVWSGGATAWVGGGDPVAATTPSATLTGTTPLYAAGCVKSLTDYVDIVSDATGFLGAVPAGYVGGISDIPPPLSLTGTPPSGQVGVPYSYTYAATGGTPPYTYSLTGALPAGLTFAGATISGTPTAINAGASFTASVTDSASKSASVANTIAIAAAPPMTLTGTLPAAATVGVAYTGTLTLGGGFVAPVTISGLPSWLTGSVSGTTVTISGTPTTAATNGFTPVATDANSQVANGSAQSVTVSAASAAFAKLSTTRKASSITLDSTALQASTTDSGAAGTVDVANCVDAATANRYWEVAITTIAGASVSAAGLMSSTSTTYGSAVGTTGDANSMALESGGTFNRTWGGTATGHTFAQGDTLMFWLHNGALYIGTVAGGWFGGASGGVPTAPLATGITGAVGPAYSADGSYGSARAWTFNFGATPWAGTIPAGATGWTA